MFVGLWTAFGLLYFSIMLYHKDFDNEPDDPGNCLLNIQGLSGALLFSLESQTTIGNLDQFLQNLKNFQFNFCAGYGFRTLSEHCPLAILTLCLQSVSGIFLESTLIAMTLAKLARANKRKSTLAFSKHACIGLYNGKLCFMIRLGDLRHNSNLLEAHVRMYFVHETRSEEGETVPLEFTDMNVGYDFGMKCFHIP